MFGVGSVRSRTGCAGPCPAKGRPGPIAVCGHSPLRAAVASWAAVGLPGVSGKGKEGLSAVPKLATLPIGRAKEEPCPAPVL